MKNSFDRLFAYCISHAHTPDRMGNLQDTGVDRSTASRQHGAIGKTNCRYHGQHCKGTTNQITGWYQKAATFGLDGLVVFFGYGVIKGTEFVLGS